MKKQFTQPEIACQPFEVEDILTASNTGSFDGVWVPLPF